MKTIIVIGALLLLASPAFTETPEWGNYDSAELLASCQDFQSSPNTIGNTMQIDIIKEQSGFHCAGYVTAVSDMLRVSRAASKKSGAGICIPDSAITFVLVDVVVKYLKKHPELLRETQIASVLKAYAEAFPCKPNEK